MTLDRDAVAAALERYDIGEELGRGGWGVVLAGRHAQLGRPVAIKQLPRAFGADPAVRQRFLTEARVVAALTHPHIVSVYDYVECDGLCLLVMEHLGGGTLWQRFTARGLALQEALAVTVATCAALQFAHDRGVLHRDIKPENVMFTDEGTLKVTDFGIAKVIGGPDTLVTARGEVLGTPAYMAPEQARAGELGPQTDVYAAGVMLYELLSGRLPFDDTGDAMALLYRHAFEDPEPLAKVAPDVPASVGEAVMRAIARDTGDRFPSSQAFGAALARAADHSLGPGWLGRSGVRVMTGDDLLAVPDQAVAPAPPRRAAATEVGAPPPPPRRPPAAPGPTPAGGGPPPGPTVRPATRAHTVGVVAIDTPAVAVQPLHEAIERPPGPWPLAGAALACLLVALGVALLGLGTPDRGGSLVGVTVNGVDVAAAGPVQLDLDDLVLVTGLPPEARRVQIAFTALGLTLGSSTADVEDAPGGRAATVDAASARYLVAGEMTGRVRPLGEDGSLVAAGERAFAVEIERSPFLTVPGAAGVLLALFLFANAESLLRSLRRGRKRTTAPVALVGLGALAGLGTVVVGWLGAFGEPTIVTVVVCVLLGGAAGALAAQAARRVARRRRFRLKRR